MLKGLTLPQLSNKILANMALKKDFIADTGETNVLSRADGKIEMELPDGQGIYPILDIAHDQIAERLKIPKQYYGRMRQTAPLLLADNINTWLHYEPRKNMVRTLDRNVRAFLSNKYQRIENEEMMSAALPVLQELKGVQIKSCEVTDKRMYIHFTVPTICGEVKKGDIVEAGGIISNSEVGWGACSVSGLLWRLICLNGMKTSEQFRRHHVGKHVDDSEELWADDTRAADDRAILLKVRDMVRAVVDEARFKANLIKLQGLTEGKITGDPVKAIEALAAKVDANESEAAAMLRSFIEAGDLSAWGMVNAVTAQAHAAQNYERAVEFEAAGGLLIDLPANEWREILKSE